MSDYMGPDHPDAYKDIEPLPRKARDWTKFKCPACKGRGRRNLELDAYGPGLHFQMTCSQCVGWGWVRSEKDSQCVHDFDHSKPVNIGPCYNQYTCEKCGKKVNIDSSG